MKKKAIIFIAIIAIMASIATVAFGRTIEEERQAVRDYLNAVDAKLATAKQANNTARIDLLHAEKAATLARWNKLQIEKEKEKPAQPQIVIIQAPSPEVSYTGHATNEVGRGVALYVNGGVDAGLIGYAANLDYDLSGLPARGLKLRVGANYISGTNPRGGDSMQAACAKLGAVYYITPFMPDFGMSLSWYVGGAGLYPVKVNAGRSGQSGQWGVEAYLGTNLSIPEFGLVNVELGYSGLKYTAAQPALKGLDAKIGYGLTF